MPTSLLNLLKDYKVVIPIIQRDYAQGRKTDKVSKIRDSFLNALFSTLKERKEPLELDFIYGYTKLSSNDSEISNHSFIPLDGQQRLTTLFLLHWFIAVKEYHLEDAKKYLAKFTYETRHSSRIFCNKLVQFIPDEFETPIGRTIQNQPWFFTAWKNDPTISSMLTMLDAIQKKFNDFGLENVWELISSDDPQIVFHLLPMDKLGLPDDLYIKMNSRGKELTEFEYFKSQFSEILKREDSNKFKRNVDQNWSDLFWNLYKSEQNPDIAKLVDNGFLRFFYYVSDMLNYKMALDLKLLSFNYDNHRRLYETEGSIDFLYSTLDTFYDTFSSNSHFFDNVFYIEEDNFNENKTRLFFQNSKVNLFKKCTDSYESSLRINPFSIGEQLLLYACIIHLINDSFDFYKRIRILRNLIANSEDTVRKENMHSLLQTVSELILTGKIITDSRFNANQIQNELEKELYIENNNGKREVLARLEDHHLLQGCLSIFKLEDDLPDYARAFRNVFDPKNQYDIISRSLLCFGDYSQKYAWRKRFGNNNNSVWRELFTPSQRRGGFKNTQDVLYLLLTHLIQTPQSNLQEIITKYLEEFDLKIDTPKDWKYYFIKYQEFRKNEDGYYYWKDSNIQYESIMMRRSTLGGFHWHPFLVALKEQSENDLLSLENYGAPLLLTKNNSILQITNFNLGFKIEPYDDSDESINFLNEIIDKKIITPDGIIHINQNTEGSDIEDRIEKSISLIGYISEI